MSVSLQRVRYYAASISWLAMLFTFFVYIMPANASGPLQITSRSLTLQNGTTDGGSKPSGVVKHLFTFKVPVSAAGQSILFKYCTTADIDAGGTCTTPHGLVTNAGVTLGTENGDATSFTTLVNTNASGPGSNGQPLVNAAAGFVPTNAQSQVQLLGVTNPDGTDCPATPNSCTFYVNVQFWSGTNATGSLLSQGTVAATVTTQIVLTGTMPESLIFCTGGSITAVSGVPNCASATSGNIFFNKLFSPSSSAFASSQMAASTNATQGYAITVSGAQLTSGTNHIPGVGATAKASATTIGTSEFGLNLVADADAAATTPALSPLSANLTPASDGTNYFGIAQAQFNTDSNYAFADSGPTGGSLTLNTIAKSDYSAGGPTGSPNPTDGQIYTATYMVNAAANQPAGTYSTTLTYICTATF